MLPNGKPSCVWRVQALAAEVGKRKLVLDVELMTPVNESRLHGGDDILGTVSLHMTTVSR